MSVFPATIAHADWSKSPARRWICAAQRIDGTYCAQTAIPAPDPPLLLDNLLAGAGGGTAVLGVDFPIGLPRAYARAAGITEFAATLPLLGASEWADFFSVAKREDEISIRRPFYPFAPGGRNRAQLLRGLNLDNAADLYRICERPTAARVAASSLFWTLGAKQAGRAAISGWQELLQPALRRFDRALGIWPFHGTFSELLASRRLVICETYPANGYDVVGLTETRRRWSKRRAEDRSAWAPTLLRWARSHSIRLSAGLERQIRGGFGARPEGEDPFDSLIGLFSMIDVVQNRALDPIPLSPADLKVEGWMLGQRLNPAG